MSISKIHWNYRCIFYSDSLIPPFSPDKNRLHNYDRDLRSWSRPLLLGSNRPQPSVQWPSWNMLPALIFMAWADNMYEYVSQVFLVNVANAKSPFRLRLSILTPDSIGWHVGPWIRNLSNFYSLNLETFSGKRLVLCSCVDLWRPAVYPDKMTFGMPWTCREANFRALLFIHLYIALQPHITS